MEKTFGYRINEIAKLWSDNNILENQKVKVKNTQANGKPWLLGSIYYLGSTCPQFDVLLDDGTFKTVQFADKGKTWNLWEPVQMGDEVEVKYLDDNEVPYGGWLKRPVTEKCTEYFVPGGLFARSYADEDYTWRRIPKTQVGFTGLTGPEGVCFGGGASGATGAMAPTGDSLKEQIKVLTKERDYWSGWASQGHVVCKKLNDEIHGLQILARKDSADIEKLTARVDDYKRANASLEKSLDQLSEQQWEARNQATAAEHEVEALTNKNLSLKNQIEDLTNQVLARDSELKDTRNHIGHLLNVLKDKEVQIEVKNKYIKNFEASGAGDKNQIVSLQGVINSKECLIDSYVVYRDQIDAALKAAGYDTTTSIWNTTLDIIKNNPNKPKEEPKEYQPLKVGDRVRMWPVQYNGKPNPDCAWGSCSIGTIQEDSLGPIGFNLYGWDFRNYTDEGKTWRRV
jgi:hypothetical protein